MTPTKKAHELMNKFAPYSEDDVNVPHTEMLMARCCALIAVDEILRTQRPGSNTFWKKVKKEIKAL